VWGHGNPLSYTTYNDGDRGSAGPWATDLRGLDEAGVDKQSMCIVLKN